MASRRQKELQTGRLARSGGTPGGTQVADRLFKEADDWKKDAAQADRLGLDPDPVDLGGLRKFFTLDEVKRVKEEDDEETGGDRVLRFTISTSDIDRDGDTINVDGWDLTNYEQNPVVLFGHDYSDLPVAQSLKTFVEDGKLKSDAQFTSEDEYKFGHTVYRLYLGGYMRATSVGFLPTKWAFVEEDDRPFGIDFENQELLEYSAVPVPSNPNALYDAKSKGIDVEPMKDWAEATLEHWSGGPGLWVPRRSLEDIVKVIGGQKTTVTFGSDPAAAIMSAGQKDQSDPPDESEDDPVADADEASDDDVEVEDDDQDAQDGDQDDADDSEGSESQDDDDDASDGDSDADDEDDEDDQDDDDDEGEAVAVSFNGDATKFMEALTAIRARAAGLTIAGPMGQKTIERVRREANFQAAKLIPGLDAETFERLFPEVLGGDPAPELKRGRVLSAKNEDRIKNARDLIDEVLGEVGDAAEVEDDGTPVEDAAPAGEQRGAGAIGEDGSEVIIELADSPAAEAVADTIDDAGDALDDVDPDLIRSVFGELLNERGVAVNGRKT